MCKTKPEKTSLLEARKISYSLIEIIKKLLKLAERRVTVDVKKAFLQKCDQFWRGVLFKPFEGGQTGGQQTNND